MAVVADADLEAEIAGDRFVDGRTDRLQLDPGGGTYSVEADTEKPGSYETTRPLRYRLSHRRSGCRRIALKRPVDR